MKYVEKRDKETLQSLIKRHIRPGSVIVSDGWAAYAGLNQIGYEHNIVNHSKEFVNNEGNHTNKIESIWGALKRMFSSIRNKRMDLVDSYIAEYLFMYYYKDKRFCEVIHSISSKYSCEWYIIYFFNNYNEFFIYIKYLSYTSSAASRIIIYGLGNKLLITEMIHH